MLHVSAGPEDFEPTSWWQIWVVDAEGHISLWMETSDEDEVKREKVKLDADNRKHRIQRLYSLSVSEWREEQP